MQLACVKCVQWQPQSGFRGFGRALCLSDARGVLWLLLWRAVTCMHPYCSVLCAKWRLPCGSLRHIYGQTWCISVQYCLLGMFTHALLFSNFGTMVKGSKGIHECAAAENMFLALDFACDSVNISTLVRKGCLSSLYCSVCQGKFSGTYLNRQGNIMQFTPLCSCGWDASNC